MNKKEEKETTPMGVVNKEKEGEGKRINCLFQRRNKRLRPLIFNNYAAA